MFRKKLRPSEALIHWVEGTGRGFDLDDLISSGRYRDREAEFARPLMDINKRYSTAEHPIGLTNPAAFEDIRNLAAQLRLIGL